MPKLENTAQLAIPALLDKLKDQAILHAIPKTLSEPFGLECQLQVNQACLLVGPLLFELEALSRERLNLLVLLTIDFLLPTNEALEAAETLYSIGLFWRPTEFQNMGVDALNFSFTGYQLNNFFSLISIFGEKNGQVRTSAEQQKFQDLQARIDLRLDDDQKRANFILTLLRLFFAN